MKSTWVANIVNGFLNLRKGRRTTEPSISKGKTFWFVSFTCTHGDGLGFGNSYATATGDFFDANGFQHGQNDNGMKNCVVLFYQQISEKEFDKALAQYVTQMEKQQKGQS